MSEDIIMSIFTGCFLGWVIALIWIVVTGGANE